jgi:3,4-dihydroxy-2-butanone 4-phosphate synthase
MLNMKRQFKLIKSLTFAMLAVSLIATGCASKKYVRQQVDEKLVAVNKNVSDLQAASKEHAERIDAVDKKAQQGISDAGRAQTTAAAAQTAATARKLQQPELKPLRPAHSEQLTPQIRPLPQRTFESPQSRTGSTV